MDTIIKVKLAMESKPKFGEDCNSCGYCCLTEVCPIGQELTGSAVAPCNLLIEKEGKHYCKLAENEITREALGIGTGCCAKTQAEVIEEIMQQQG